MVFFDAQEKPSAQDLADATGGKVSRNGESAIVGFRGRGYLIVEPAYYVHDGQLQPAARIKGTMRKGNAEARRQIGMMLQSANIRLLDNRRI